MDSVTSYVTDLTHSPSSYPVHQRQAFQAKTRCSCLNCQDSLSTIGHHSSHHVSNNQINNAPPPRHIHRHQHHHRFHHHHSHQHHNQYHQQQQQNINTNLNTCTRTCFSQLAGHLIPHVPAGGSCSCYSHVTVQHVPISRPETPPPPPPPPSFSCTSSGCPCCQYSSNSIPHYQRISRLHLATDNITNHPPHYADAFAPPPLLHASWEPTGGATFEPLRPQALRHVYISSPSPTRSSSREYHTHTHHHHQISLRRRLHCPENLQNFEQELQNLAARHRHYPGRSSSHPYPSGIFHPTSEFYIREPILRLEERSTAMPMSVPYFIEEEIEPGPLEYDYFEWNSGGRVSEPAGITKEHLAKLPSYLVTKVTLEDFNETDRCVVCMCEYELNDRLRVLPCAHEFHCECVDKWLSTNATCPICRSVVELT